MITTGKQLPVTYLKVDYKILINTLPIFKDEMAAWGIQCNTVSFRSKCTRVTTARISKQTNKKRIPSLSWTQPFQVWN